MAGWPPRSAPPTCWGNAAATAATAPTSPPTATTRPPAHSRSTVWTPDEIEASIRGALDPDDTRVAHPTPDPSREPSTPAAITEQATTAPPAAPVVRELHYAYHRRARPADLTDLTGTTAARPDPVRRPHPHLSVPLGVTAGGASVPLDLTATPALALTAAHTPDPLATPAAADSAADGAGGAGGASVIRTGDRAGDVARAVLLTVAAGLRTLTGDPLGHVVITAADLRHLLGLTDLTTHTVALPGTIRVVEDLDAALDELDIALAHRAPFPHPDDPVEAAVVLIATAPRPGTPITRMQRLLTAGHPHRICAVLLGDWPTPTRITVAPDGTAARITGGLPTALNGARLFTVPRHDALDLLTALARPTDPPHTLTTDTRTTDTHTGDPADPDDNTDDVDLADLADAARHGGGGADEAASTADTDTGTDARASDATPAGPVLSLRLFGRLSLRYHPAGIAEDNTGPERVDSPGPVRAGAGRPAQRPPPRTTHLPRPTPRRGTPGPADRTPMARRRNRPPHRTAERHPHPPTRQPHPTHQTAHAPGHPHQQGRALPAQPQPDH